LENLGIKNIENIYIIPEGGANDFAVLGCQEISTDIVENQKQKFDAICCASGTGSTLAGIILGCPSPTVQKIGFAVVKGGEFLETDIKKMIAKQTTQKLDFKLQTTYHFGGYAKKNSILTEFIQDFEQTYQFRIEPIYTGKMFFGLFDLIQQGYFAKNSKIVAIHTGGIY
jgi:1-aminocyclopropane-1-carboxylate deaminase/D-cysteine desulfhydrase-like pyridoxal-dependent ACC family enzyme